MKTQPLIGKLVVLLILLNLLLSLGISLPAQADPIIDIVFDLDGVFLETPSKTEKDKIPEGKLIVANGSQYRISDGAGEILAALLKLPNVRISFFSSSTPERNRQALQQIRLPDGRTAWDVAAGRVFNRSDITQKETGGSHKDLTKVAPDVDLSRAILVDDQDGYADPAQRKNFLWVTGFADPLRENVLDDYLNEARNGDREWADDIAYEFLTSRNKLARVYGLIEEAIEISHKEGISVVDALNRVQWTSEGHLRRDALSVGPYRRGARRFREVNPDYHFTTLIPRGTPNCDEVLRLIAPQGKTGL